MFEVIKSQLANTAEEVTDFVFDGSAKVASGALGKIAALIKASKIVDDATIERIESAAQARIKELNEAADKWAEFGVPSDATADRAALKLAAEKGAIKGFEKLEEVSDSVLDSALEAASGLKAKIDAIIKESDYLPNSLLADIDLAFSKLEESRDVADSKVGVEMMPDSLKKLSEEEAAKEEATKEDVATETADASGGTKDEVSNTNVETESNPLADHITEATAGINIAGDTSTTDTATL